MARVSNKLTDRTIKNATKPGRLSDGGGLYLNIGKRQNRSWLYMWTTSTRDPVSGRYKQKRYEMGLGSFPAVSLAQARHLASNARQLVAQGGDPIAARRKGAEPTFLECCDKFLDGVESQWSNAKHRQQWRNTLQTYCRPIEHMRIGSVGTEDVLRCLNPIWTEKPETASRLRGRIERVLSFARAKGWREGENPALWRGNLDAILPKPMKLARGHHKAMPYHEVPEFLHRLRALEAMAARALEFLILTASRSGEVLLAQWTELDLEAGVWTIPPNRMKMRKEHRVPLTDVTMDILAPMAEAQVSEFVFPGQKNNRPLSNMALAMLLKRMKVTDATPHGFRSSFRDWAGDETAFPRELAEQCLAHRIGDATEQAYRRSDALERRRGLLEAWASYCNNIDQPADVVRLYA